MALRAEVSVPIALGTGVVVWAIFRMNMPSLADVKASPSMQSQGGGNAIESARKVSTWESAAVVAAISLITKDPTVFVIGGGMVVLFDFSFRHANAQDNVTGTVLPEFGANAYVGAGSEGINASVSG